MRVGDGEKYACPVIVAYNIMNAFEGKKWPLLKEEDSLNFLMEALKPKAKKKSLRLLELFR